MDSAVDINNNNNKNNNNNNIVTPEEQDSAQSPFKVPDVNPFANPNKEEETNEVIFEGKNVSVPATNVDDTHEYAKNISYSAAVDDVCKEEELTANINKQTDSSKSPIKTDADSSQYYINQMPHFTSAIPGLLFSDNQEYPIDDPLAAENLSSSAEHKNKTIMEAMEQQAADIKRIKITKDSEDNENNKELKRTKSSRSLKTLSTKLKNLKSPIEVPTEGLSEKEALGVESETLPLEKRSMNLKEPLLGVSRYNRHSTTINEPLLKIHNFIDSDSVESSMNSPVGPETPTFPPSTNPLKSSDNVDRSNPFFSENFTSLIATGNELKNQSNSGENEKNILGTQNKIINLQENSSPFQPPSVGKYSGSSKKNAKNFVSKHKYAIIISLLLFFFIVSCGTMIPLTIYYSRGTASSVMKYFERLSPNSKAAALDELISKYDYVKGEFNFQYRNSSQPASKIDRKAPHRSNAKSSRGRVLYNTFEGINEKYKKDKEIEALMNNSALQNVFYGIDYAPRGVIAPICGASLHEIMLDLAVLSRVTTRIRTYGMQCDQPNFVLDALLELGLNMTLSMGVWIGADENLNSAQLSVMEDVLRSYPRRLFDSVMIGNEVLFRQEKSSNDLVNYITKTKEILNRIGYTDLPVGTSEIGSKIDSMVLQSSDIIGANVHPFFGGDDVKVATKWTLDFLHNQIAAKSGNKNIFVSEVGWPSGGGKYINSVADRESLEYFINNWVCEVNKKDIEWYWFEAFDEPWKKIYDTPSTQWEAQWGIFTSDRVLKITLPDCNDYANSTAVN